MEVVFMFKNYYLVGQTVANGAVALAMNESKQYKTTRGTSTKLALLEGLKTVLEMVPTNAEGMTDKVTAIYTIDMVSSGFVYDSAQSWLRTGKTGSGTVMEPTELKLLKEVYLMLSERSLNAKILSVKHIAKDDKKGGALLKAAWDMLKSSKIQAGVGVQTQLSPIEIQLVEIEKQIVAAASAMDFAKVQELVNMSATLKTALSAIKGSPVDMPQERSIVDTDTGFTVDMEPAPQEKSLADMLGSIETQEETGAATAEVGF